MSVKRKNAASGMSLSGQLSEKDWDFRDVRTDALIACCYWEYARESARIRAAFDPEDKIFFPNPTPTYVLSPAGQRFKTSSEINTPRMQFFERIRMEALPVLEVFRHAKKEADSPFELPWLKLSVSARQAIIAELSPYFAEKPGLTFLPFNRCSDLRDLGIADEEHRCAERNAELGIERFRVEAWEMLATALREHGRNYDVARTRETGFGPRHEVEGEIVAPDGRRPRIRTVWQFDRGQIAPRLITAYPLDATI